MRIGVVHSFYRSDVPSGENIAVDQHLAALTRAGVGTVLFARQTDEMRKSPYYELASGVRVATGVDLRSQLEEIRNADLDVLHIHNLFPNFGTRWLGKVDVPIVSTVHNFRSVCANGLLLRDGRPCTECLTRGAFSAVVHSCYRDSRLASLPLAVSTRGGAGRNPLFRHSKKVIIQSRRALRLLEGAGLPPEKSYLLPGFVERLHEGPAAMPTRPRFVFVGRFSPEKGLAQLLAGWPPDVPLDVIGGGDASLSEGFALDGRFSFLGELPMSDVRRRLPSYAGLVFPGLCPEGAYPLVVREAFEAGVPVVALEGSSASDLVAETSAGAVYEGEGGKGLAQALQEVEQGGDGLRSRARRAYEGLLSEDAWLSRLLAMYSSVTGT